MKKIICAALAVCTIGLAMTSCSAKKQDVQTVKDPSCNFSFECPDEWEVTHTNGMLSAINPEDVSKANVTAFCFDLGKDNENKSALEYWEVYKKQLSDTFGKIDEKSAKEVEYKDTDYIDSAMHAKYNTTIGKDVFCCETRLIIFDNKVYTLTLTQGAQTEENEENYNNHTDEFAKIVKTFKIK